MTGLCLVYFCFCVLIHAYSFILILMCPYSSLQLLMFTCSSSRSLVIHVYIQSLFCFFFVLHGVQSPREKEGLPVRRYSFQVKAFQWCILANDSQMGFRVFGIFRRHLQNHAEENYMSSIELVLTGHAQACTSCGSADPCLPIGILHLSQYVIIVPLGYYGTMGIFYVD